MTGFINYYGRNPFPDDYDHTLDWLGYTYLGPIMVPPVPPTFGMTDRGGTGVVYYLMWDGNNNLVLTDQPPRPFTVPTGASWNTTTQYGQDTYVFGPWDGPYVGQFRLGVTTIPPTGFASGEPRLQFDWIGNGIPGQGATYTTTSPPVCAPNIFGPQMQLYPEPSNYPAPGVPTIPGIPSSTPPPTGGGYVAFLEAGTTNEPPALNMDQVVTDQAPKGGQEPTPWHIVYFLAS